MLVKPENFVEDGLSGLRRTSSAEADNIIANTGIRIRLTVQGEDETVHAGDSDLVAENPRITNERH